MNSLHLLGMPPEALTFVRAIHDTNVCDIAFKGNLYEGFGMECGVRQGCPLSPLLFAALVDILLRKLLKAFPTGVTRAFADDIGMVIEEWSKDLGTAHSIFSEFASMSGLDLNIPKTVLIPLWPGGWMRRRRPLSNPPQSGRISKLPRRGHT